MTNQIIPQIRRWIHSVDDKELNNNGRSFAGFYLLCTSEPFPGADFYLRNGKLVIEKRNTSWDDPEYTNDVGVIYAFYKRYVGIMPCEVKKSNSMVD